VRGLGARLKLGSDYQRERRNRSLAHQSTGLGMAILLDIKVADLC
jgi:hypothetical protein